VYIVTDLLPGGDLHRMLNAVGGGMLDERAAAFYLGCMVGSASCSAGGSQGFARTQRLMWCTCGAASA